MTMRAKQIAAVLEFVGIPGDWDSVDALHELANVQADYLISGKRADDDVNEV